MISYVSIYYNYNRKCWSINIKIDTSERIAPHCVPLTKGSSVMPRAESLRQKRLFSHKSHTDTLEDRSEEDVICIELSRRDTMGRNTF